jgi:lipid-binding SYLF domain-containing protein
MAVGVRAFFTISGGSWETQFGAEDVPLVMIIMNDEGMRHLLSDKFQIGGEVSGPRVQLDATLRRELIGKLPRRF